MISLTPTPPPPEPCNPWLPSDLPIYTARWSGSETMYCASPCPLTAFAGMCEMAAKVAGATKERTLYEP